MGQLHPVNEHEAGWGIWEEPCVEHGSFKPPFRLNPKTCYLRINRHTIRLYGCGHWRREWIVTLAHELVHVLQWVFVCRMDVEEVFRRPSRYDAMDDAEVWPLRVEGFVARLLGIRFTT